jgi:DNA-binding MarR family transcriptional regulator
MTATTPWLTAEEQRAWRSFLSACQSLFGAVDAQLLRESGLPLGYYEILVHLSEAPDRALRMSQLAKASTYSRSRLSHAVARLEERRLVERRDCPTDRRGQVAQLTDEGFALLEAAAPGHVEQVRRSLIDALTAEQVGHLAAISTAIIAATGKGAAPPCTESPCTEAADAELPDTESSCNEAADTESPCTELADPELADAELTNAGLVPDRGESDAR